MNKRNDRIAGPVPAIMAALALLAPAAAACGADSETTWYTVHMGENKSGHARHTRTVKEDKVVTELELSFSIARGATPLSVTIVQTSYETPEGEPLGYELENDMGLMAQTVEATIEDGTLTTVTTTGERRQTRTQEWPEGALLSEGLRLLALREGLEPGTEYTARTFEITSGEALDTEIRVNERKKLDLYGRVVMATELESTFATTLGEITTTSYVSDDFRLLRSDTPMLGMSLRMTSCPKAVALAEVEPAELMDRICVACPEPDGDPHEAGAVVFRLRPTEDRELKIPETDNQTVAKTAGGDLLITIRPSGAPRSAALPYDGEDEAAGAALKPSRYVESDDERVVALAREAVGDAGDAATAAYRIEAFVRDYIDDKHLGVGYGSAAEVAESREGDCTEHAVLAAAMCRAAGIPAQVASGVAYIDRFDGREHVLGPHAWVRAYVGDRWIWLDAALPGGHGPARILLTEDMDDFGGWIAEATTMGYFEVVEMTLEP